VEIMVGLPIAGISTIFYAVLLLGMGATKLWRWALGSIPRIGKRGREKPGDRSVLTNSSFHRSPAHQARRTVFKSLDLGWPPDVQLYEPVLSGLVYVNSDDPHHADEATAKSGAP
jgi:hypothetical protein